MIRSLLFAAILATAFSTQAELDMTLPPFPLVGDFRDKNQAMDDFAQLKTNKFGADEIPAKSGDRMFSWIYTKASVRSPIDEDKGGFALRSSQVREVCRTEDKLLYDTITTYDPYGRRYTWTPPAKKNTKKPASHFIALMGCSFTFGEGVQDKETLSYLLSEKMPDHEGYNYGYSGSAPNSYLAMIQSGRFKKEMSQKNGILVYVSLDQAHVVRANGYLNSLKWLKNSPYYEREGGHLVRKGTFLTGRPILTQLLLAYDQVRVFLGANPENDFPRLFSFNYDYYCSLVKEMQLAFLKQYPEAKFLVYVHPFQAHLMAKESVECFTKNKIPFVRGEISRKIKNLTIPIDNHPTALANQLIAEDIKLKVLSLLSEEKTKMD